MIKFFRKIRQNLLMENKTGKYFKYAIGEIILVVIGILIALQINNWNEDRKDTLKEQVYLVNLKKDIADDIAFNKRYILDRYQKKVSVLKKGKAHYQGEIKVKDTIAFLNDIGYGNVFGNVIWGFNMTTYNQLVNTGDFKVIANDSLKEAILNYYNLLNATDQSSKLKPTGYISFTNSMAPFNRNDPKNISAFDAQLFMSKIKSEDYYRLANLELTLAHEVNENAKRVNDEAAQLIELIDKHVND
jgi:hypothetical protein